MVLPAPSRKLRYWSYWRMRTARPKLAWATGWVQVSSGPLSKNCLEMKVERTIHCASTCQPRRRPRVPVPALPRNQKKKKNNWSNRHLKSRITHLLHLPLACKAPRLWHFPPHLYIAHVPWFSLAINSTDAHGHRDIVHPGCQKPHLSVRAVGCLQDPWEMLC